MNAMSTTLLIFILHILLSFTGDVTMISSAATFTQKQTEACLILAQQNQTVPDTKEKLIGLTASKTRNSQKRQNAMIIAPEDDTQDSNQSIVPAFAQMQSQIFSELVKQNISIEGFDKEPPEKELIGLSAVNPDRSLTYLQPHKQDLILKNDKNNPPGKNFISLSACILKRSKAFLELLNQYMIPKIFNKEPPEKTLSTLLKFILKQSKALIELLKQNQILKAAKNDPPEKHFSLVSAFILKQLKAFLELLNRDMNHKTFNKEPPEKKFISLSAFILKQSKAFLELLNKYMNHKTFNKEPPEKHLSTIPSLDSKQFTACLPPFKQKLMLEIFKIDPPHNFYRNEQRFYFTDQHGGIRDSKERFYYNKKQFDTVDREKFSKQKAKSIAYDKSSPICLKDAEAVINPKQRDLTCRSRLRDAELQTQGCKQSTNEFKMPVKLYCK